MEQKQMCRSLRFEDKQPCRSNATENSWYCRHHGEIAVCLAINTQLVINKQEDSEALWEVEDYVRRYSRSILSGDLNHNYWWMRTYKKQQRQKGHCQSLELETGEVCESYIGYDYRFCEYHQLQHDVLCESYHLDKMNMDSYGVSYTTKKFTEFILRKQFNQIFIVREDDGHRKRFGYLYNGMFDYPYPEENRTSIDVEFYREARNQYICIEKETSYVPIPWYRYCDEDEDSEDDDQCESDEPPTVVQQTEVYEEENWDED